MVVTGRVQGVFFRDFTRTKAKALDVKGWVRNLFDGRRAPAVMQRLRSRLKDLLHDSHDEFLPGDRYAEWMTPERDIIRNALGPLKQT